MTAAFAREKAWRVSLDNVGSAQAAALLREYYIEVSDRYYQLHCGRTSTPAEIEQGLAGSPGDDLAPPSGVFLLGRYGDAPGGLRGSARARSGYGRADPGVRAPRRARYGRRLEHPARRG